MRLLLLAICVLFTTLAHGQTLKPVPPIDKVKDTLALRIDSIKNIIKKFDDEAIQEYKNEKEFQYGEDDPKTQSWWDRFWSAFWRWIAELFGDGTKKAQKTALAPFLKYLLIAICVGLVVFVVIKLVGVKMFAGKSKSVDVPYDETLENIHEIDFNEEIEVALQNKNYRLAVRLLYLSTLKLLSDKELIDWQPNKTNQAYLGEVPQEQAPEFALLTRNFEYVWYGDFSLDASTFGEIQTSFQQFKAAVK